MTRKSIYGVPLETTSTTAKITDDQVRLIRASKASNGYLAKKYGVWPSTISAIKNHKVRRNVK